MIPRACVALPQAHDFAKSGVFMNPRSPQHATPDSKDCSLDHRSSSHHKHTYPVATATAFAVKVDYTVFALLKLTSAPVTASAVAWAPTSAGCLVLEVKLGALLRLVWIAVLLVIAMA